MDDKPRVTIYQLKIILGGRSKVNDPKLQLHAAHILPKGKYRSLGYDLLNLHCLCYACHRYWGHNGPFEATEWVKTEFPNRYYYLQLQTDNAIKTTVGYYQERIAKVKEMLNTE